MSSVTTVVLIPENDDEDAIANLNRSWHDLREQFIEAETGGYKYGDSVWTCVYKSLDRDVLVARFKAQQWTGPVWLILRHEDAASYDLVSFTPPEPGAVQLSPFVEASVSPRNGADQCSCGTWLSCGPDPQYGTVWFCPDCGRNYVDE